MFRLIMRELKNHAPFTILGSSTGILLMMFFQKLPKETSFRIFYVLHPVHVLLSAFVTAAVYGLHSCECIGAKCFMGKCNLWKLFLIGYIGSVGIATISDSIIPYLGEVMLGMPNRGAHIGFIEKWWLINPLAIAGIAYSLFWRRTKFPHAGHVLISTWASLFHVLMAVSGTIGGWSYVIIFIFLFFAVWLPCCVSDIVFPLLFVKK